MKAQSTGPLLSAVFVDYDNIYLSLKRKSEEAAKRFAKDAGLWLKEIELGRLITPTNASPAPAARRIVMNRCYGNPVPRRNAHDNSTDMNSFPFVRHHFLRAGCEVVDCPPLTAQLKNSADIRMVMDVRDMLGHETRFEEFILLSGDADFTPVLHRLRAHARRTVVYANDHTAAPYTAISDGEVREQDLIALLLEGHVAADAEPAVAAPASSAGIEAMRREIVGEVVSSVRASAQPLPLEALADRAVRLLGHERTVGSGWGGAGSFRDLLSKGLPADIRLSDHAPYLVFDTSRHLQSPQPARPEKRIESRYEPAREARLEPRSSPEEQPLQTAAGPQPPEPAQRYAAAPAARQASPPVQQSAPAMRATASAPPSHQQPSRPATYDVPPAPQRQPAPSPLAPNATQSPPAPSGMPPARPQEPNSAIRQSIARIHEACQAPPLAPPEYRALFEVMAEEINANGLAGSQTLVNIMQRARELGVEIRRDDVRFVLEVVSEPDPWFEQGASANLFASRFRNFVVARCRSQGLSLSSDELDLIDAWFGGSPVAQRTAVAAPAATQARTPTPQTQAPAGQPAYAPQAQPAPQQQAAQAASREGWWSLDEGRSHVADTRAGAPPEDEFPRIIRTRLRG